MENSKIEQDEQERRKLQEYIFNLEEVQDEAEELAVSHEKLKQAQDLLVTILSSTMHGICLLRNSRFVWCNKALTDIIGWDQEELVGKSTEKLFPSTEEYIRMREIIYNNSAQGGLITYEYNYVHKKGHRVPCLVTGRVLDKDDISQGYVFSVTDFTDRKKAEEALKESEERYRLFFQQDTSAFYISTVEGRLIACNPSYARMFGFASVEEALNSNTDAIYPSKKARENFLKLLKKNKKLYQYESEYRHSNGTRIYTVENAIGSFNDYGELVEFKGFLLDETERKLAENALRESEEKFRVLVEKSPMGISSIDRNGHYKYINPKFIEMFGYTLKDIPTGREWFKKSYPDPEYRDQVIATWVKDLKRYKIGESRPRQYTVTCKDSSKKVINFRPVAMKSGNHFVIYEDVTEQERLRTQLQRAQKMEAIGTLAGGVAHDLNNILSGLVSYPDLLLREIPEKSPLRKPMLTIQRSGERAAAIVQDLLTLARRGVSVSEVVNLNYILSEYLMSPEHERLKEFHPNVKLQTDLEEDLLNILGSPVHLSKTIMNLVSNAAEAMTDGGRIFISTQNQYIDQPVRGYDDIEEGDYVIFRVSDTGIGISPDEAERIFEPFYTKKQMGRSGTGLGMAVVWGTIKDHRGYIDVKSAQGKGTTFTLYFPITRKGLTKDESLVSIEDYMGEGEPVLVVDDIEEQREIASRILKKLGYSVTTVSSGEDAIDYLKENSADLLILDMIMGTGIDGLETYKKILEFRPGQKAIIVSGFSETDRVKESRRLGAGAYIKKPYLLEKIGKAVREELKDNTKETL
ncbi:MAG: PAS domain S-box protein, partial [Thermodesulfobacteriota bacterium]|nr:PAS domain S-box protein [Thermodesulfobacteriota bacterium]